MEEFWGGYFEEVWVAARTKELDQYRCAVAAADALSQMNRVIAWATFAYHPDPLHDDHGAAAAAATPAEPAAPAGSACGRWAPEAQLRPAVIDRHSRFEVKASSVEERAKLSPTKRPDSPGRPRTPETPKGKLSRGRSTRGDAAATWASTTGFDDTAVEIRDLSDPMERGVKGKKGGGFGLTDVEREYFEQMARDKEEAERRKAVEAERLAEAARVKREWAEAMREVEGKQWTVDAEGKVIVVVPLEGDKMPPRTVPVKYATGEKKDGAGAGDKDKGGKKAAAAAAVAAAVAGGVGPGSPHSPMSDGGKHSAAPSKFGRTGPRFQESAEEQPPLTKTLLPEDGVDMVYGKARKAGRRFGGDDAHMSRADYLEKTGFGPPGDRTAGEADDGAGAGGGDAGGKKKGVKANKFPTIDPFKGGRPRAGAPGSPGSPSPSAFGESGVTAASQGAGARVASPVGGGGAASPVAGGRSFESFEEAEAFAVEKERELLERLNANGGGGGSGSPVQPSPVQRSRPNALPHKPMRDVRNAILPGPTPTAYRAKLAPPTPAGMTTGHGLVVGGTAATEDPAAATRHGKNPFASHKAAPKPEVVSIPEESESQGLRYQVASRDSDRGASR